MSKIVGKDYVGHRESYWRLLPFDKSFQNHILWVSEMGFEKSQI